MKKMLPFLSFVFVFGMIAAFATPEEFKESRQYEHVQFRGSVFEDFYQKKVPIDDIVICAYDPATESMKVIPFQIDERVIAPDPFSPSKTRASYFLTDSTSGYLDGEDELVCMLRDLGPKAPRHVWIDDETARENLRYEVVVYNRDDQEKLENALYGYVYHAPGLTSRFEVPNPYNFQYDAENDIISCSNYSVRFSKSNGMIEDVKLFPPLGTGVDIFDSIKLRVVGVLDFGIINIAPGKNGEEAMNERDNFYLFPFEGSIDDGAYLGVTEKPVVRLVREVHQTLRVGNFNLPDVDFFVETKFYPYAGFNAQGANLNPDSLRKQFPEADDILIDIDLVRQSWDFNENAAGMKFYNRNNENVIIDGVPDNNLNKSLVNRTWPALVDTVINGERTKVWVDVEGISEWTMASGDQGTVFSHIKIIDTSHEKIELYYHDNQAGGQDDESFIKEGDTGDGKSYGDQGVKILDTKNLDLNFAVYFVDGNKDQAFGTLMGENFEVGSQQARVAQSFVPNSVADAMNGAPIEYVLNQNYPNPFNSTTRVSFALPRQSQTELRIIDLNGRLVKTLVNEVRDAGVHDVTWNGTNEFGEDVPSGVYLYQLRANDFMASKKLLLVK